MYRHNTAPPLLCEWVSPYKNNDTLPSYTPTWCKVFVITLMIFYLIITAPFIVILPLLPLTTPFHWWEAPLNMLIKFAANCSPCAQCGAYRHNHITNNGL